MDSKLFFEFTTLYVDGKKKNTYSTLLVVAEVCGIKSYLQIDTACPVTILDDDFFNQRLINKGLNKNNNHIKDKWFTTQYEHTNNVEINFNNGIIFKPETTYIEKDLTKEETKNQKTISRFNLPFAGYIGFDFFEGKVFEINYQKKAFYFYNNGERFNYPKENTLKIERKSILLPTIMNGVSFYSIFDTASSAYNLILEQSLFEQFFKKLTTAKTAIITRPDFLVKEYFVEKKGVSIQIGNFIFSSTKKEKFSTVDKKMNNYSFGKKLEYMHAAIIGNLPFLKKSLIIDLQNNKFLIK